MIYIHISEINPDIQQGNDCEFNCVGCSYMEDVDFDKETKQLYVKCKNN